MKINEIKHNHSLTDLLKVILFSILMILPFLSVATRCLYVICNKNAKDSYSNYVETITTNVSLTSTLVEGQTYTVNPIFYKESTTTTYYEVLNNQTNIKELYFPNNNNFTTITKFAMATSETRTRLIVYNDQNYNESKFNITKPFYFVSNGTNETNSQTNAWWSITTLSYNTGKLDNAFEYSVSKLTEDNLFNWVENTGVYTGIKAMTDNLQIDMLVIPMIVTYWFLLTVIYVIIDLILKAFTTLTHMLIKKA